MALTLSDSFCVERFRPEFRELVSEYVDLLFANEAEITSLYEVENFDDALQAARKDVEHGAITRSEKGCVILEGDEVHIIDALPVSEVVDTTGAGDQFAAGFLYGMTNGKAVAESGRLGVLAASEVISHMGGRPRKNLKELAEAHELI